MKKRVFRLGSRKRLSRNPAEPANPADLRMLGQVSRKSRSIVDGSIDTAHISNLPYGKSDVKVFYGWGFIFMV